MSRRRSRAPRTWPQRLLIACNCLLVVACLSAAAGFSFVRARIADLNVVSAGLSLAPEAGADQPRNLLIIGTDNADRLGAKDPVRRDRGVGERLADVIMIIRFDPAAQQARLISIPRDTYLPTAPFGTKQRINATIFGPDGPQHLIQTIKDDFGISIDNYVEIDFAGFRELVQLLDGVPVYLTTPVRDRNTGLFQPKAGCVTLDSFQALAYARSRHFQYQQNGKWVDDPSGDLGRISRQQDFIKRAAKRAIDKGARNPATALELLSAASSAITIDETLTLGQMRSLANQFRNFNVDQLDSTQVPTRAAPIGGVAYQAVEWDAARPLLAPFWGAPGPDLGPRDFVVTVAPRSSGPAAADVVAALEQRGIDGDVASSASSVGTMVAKRTGTTIAFGPDGRDAATALARWLDASDLGYVYDPSLPGRRVVLSIGSGMQNVQDQQAAAGAVEAAPEPTSSTTTSTTATSTTAGASSTTSPTAGASSTTVADTAPGTTTTVPGIVPTDPAAELRCSASG